MKKTNNRITHFRLSKRLIRRLSGSQLLLLLPTIVDRLVQESVKRKEHGHEHLSLNSKNLRDQCGTDSIMSTDIRLDSFYDNSMNDSTSTKICESLISSQMSNYIIGTLKECVDRSTSKYQKKLNPSTDLPKRVSNSDYKTQKQNGHLKKYYSSHIPNSKKVNPHRTENENQKITILRFKKSLEMRHFENFENINDSQEIGYSERCTFVERSLYSSKNQYYTVLMKEIQICRCYKVKWSKETYSSDCSTDSLVSTIKMSRTISNMSPSCTAEIRVDYFEESDCQSESLAIKSELVRGTNFCKEGTNNETEAEDLPSESNSTHTEDNLCMLPSGGLLCSQNLFDINQKGDTYAEEKIKSENQKRRNLRIEGIRKSTAPSMVSKNYGILFSTTTSKQKPKMCMFKGTLASQSLQQEVDENLHQVEVGQVPKLKEAKIGLSTGKIVNGRYCHGWECSYKACATFNPEARPSCFNCFNPRWCPPHLSRRNNICRDCGYVNYKSRLYCKKCKFIFFKLNPNNKLCKEK